MVREVPAGLATSRRGAGWFSHSSERTKGAFASRPLTKRAAIAICRPARRLRDASRYLQSLL